MSANPSPTESPAPPRLTDSPWFWVYLFSTGAFAALLLMQTKYQNRQEHLERVYHYGTRTLQRPAGATLSDPTGKSASGATESATSAAASGTTTGGADAPGASDNAPDETPLAAEPSPEQPPHGTLISLVPLRVLAGLAMVVSFIALQWSYFRRRAKAIA